MKKISFVILTFSLLIIFQSCEKKSPVEYNDSIIEQQINVVDKIDELKKAIDNYNVLPADVAVSEMDVAYNKTLFQIDTAIIFLQTIEDFKGDNSLRQGADELFKTYKSVVETEYKRIIELYKLPDNLFTEKEILELDELVKTSSKKMNEAYDKFLKVQQEFAKNNKLALE